MSSSIDFSGPMSEILRECTKEAHTRVETSAGAAALLAGEVSKSEYVRFLMMLWHVYAALELGLERHATNPVLELTYNPPLLQRAPSISADIAHLLGVSESSWKGHSIHKSLLANAPVALTDYVNRIHELADSQDPGKLLAHAYVRYLGDLSGGQTIRHTIAKAYGLDEASGQGLSFYAFKELRSSKPAKQGEMKRIKEWFREGMNAGTRSDSELKASIASEANLVFELNGGLFNAVRVDAVQEGETSYESYEEDEQPILITPPGRSDYSGYSVASVATVIVAVSLAHFALTVGGFTGTRGYAKLELLEQWLESTWKSITAH